MSGMDVVLVTSGSYRSGIARRPYATQPGPTRPRLRCRAFEPGRLLHGHALGKIARLIDVGSLEDRRMVGEELQRDAVDDGCLHVTDLPRHLDDRDPIARGDAALG